MVCVISTLKAWGYSNTRLGTSEQGGRPQAPTDTYSFFSQELTTPERRGLWSRRAYRRGCRGQQEPPSPRLAPRKPQEERTPFPQWTGVLAGLHKEQGAFFFQVEFI